MRDEADWFAFDLQGPGVSTDELREFLGPLTRKLEASNITYTSHFEQFDSYLESYEAMFAPIPVVSSLVLSIACSADRTCLGCHAIRRSIYPQRSRHEQT